MYIQSARAVTMFLLDNRLLLLPRGVLYLAVHACWDRPIPVPTTGSAREQGISLSQYCVSTSLEVWVSRAYPCDPSLPLRVTPGFWCAGPPPPTSPPTGSGLPPPPAGTISQGVLDFATRAANGTIACEGTANAQIFGGAASTTIRQVS